jgi:hypothetical protein
MAYDYYKMTNASQNHIQIYGIQTSGLAILAGDQMRKPEWGYMV